MMIFDCHLLLHCYTAQVDNYATFFLFLFHFMMDKCWPDDRVEHGMSW